MKALWIILAAACGLFAVYFVVQDDYEKAFVAAAAGAVCWLLNYRQQLRASMPKEEQEENESDEEVRS
jgi:hypothetical protein